MLLLACNHAPRRPHSFPTRRSSDLEEPRLLAGRDDQDLAPRESIARRPRERDRLAGGDRKSTRLNSSHGYTSYAVFSLKKKKGCRNVSSPEPLRFGGSRRYSGSATA